MHKSYLEVQGDDESLAIKVKHCLIQIEDNSFFDWDCTDVDVVTGSYNTLPKQVKTPPFTKDFFEYVNKEAA